MMFTNEQYALFTTQLRNLLTILEQCTPEQIHALQETNEKERTKEKDKKENHHHLNSFDDNDKDDDKNDDDDLIFRVSLFFLSIGYTNAYAQTAEIWQYNKSIGWKMRNGSAINNREAWLKRAQPKSGKMAYPYHGRVFANIIDSLARYSRDKCKPEEIHQMINSFVGFREEGDAVYVGFSTFLVKDLVERLCRENQSIVETFFTHMRSTFPNMVQLRLEKN